MHLIGAGNNHGEYAALKPTLSEGCLVDIAVTEVACNYADVMVEDRPFDMVKMQKNREEYIFQQVIRSP
jgi:hypothetical protein